MFVPLAVDLAFFVMEAMMLAAIEELQAEVEEDLGRPARFANRPTVYCTSCQTLFEGLAQYRHHADNHAGHRQRSVVLARRRRRAIAAWEAHCLSTRQELTLQAQVALENGVVPPE